MNHRILIPAVIGSILIGSLRAAEPVDTLFARANVAFQSGKFDEAAKAYEAIVVSGQTSVAIYYNLGNAHFRNGSVGKAVLAYERALKLDPSDEDVTHNLALARLRAVDRIEPVPEFFLVSWIRRTNAIIPVSVSKVLFLVSWIVVFAGLTMLLLTPSMSILRWSRAVFLGSAAAALLFGILWGAQSTTLREENGAVICAPTVTARSAPDPKSVDAFVVHEGLKVRVTDQVDDYAKITLADGKVGWVKSTEVEKI